MLYVILSALLVLTSGFAHFFPRYYFSELMLSFLPYLVIMFLVFGIISLVILNRYLRANREGKTSPRRYKMSGLFALCLAVLFFLGSNQLTSFYKTPAPFVSSGSSLTVLFANIHKNNIEYSGLEELITRTNPDVVMFVEFADHHYQHLKPFLQKNYPYINSTTWSKQFIGSIVFSKQKIDNRADNFPQGRRRYGYFSLDLAGHPYYFYLIHTSSPDSYAHFVMRNDQLATFDKDFALHAQQRSLQSPVVVVGDFNTTPWSAYYGDIDQVFSGSLVDFSRYLPFVRTWRLFQFPLVQAHIDHIRATSGTVQSLTALPVLGSDHLAYLFRIAY